MKDLIISICCILVLVGVWAVYGLFALHTTETCFETIETQLLPAIDQENWKTAEQSFDALEDTWQSFRRISYYFLSTEAVNEADYTMSKSRYYILNEDPSNASGEIACFRDQLKALYDTEAPTPANIL